VADVLIEADLTLKIFGCGLQCCFDP